MSTAAVLASVSVPENSRPGFSFRQLVATLLLLIAAINCNANTPPPLAFDTRKICIATDRSVTYLHVDVAQSPQQRALGLMGRKRLATNSGMLFIYPKRQPADTGYWMYLTGIPLDIAFLDEDGTILSIQAMEPCTARNQHQCPTYLAGTEFRYALEANKGFFARHYITVGNRVNLNAGRCL